MAGYTHLLWDIDRTILDFDAAESAAMKTLFGKFGFGTCTDEMVERYAAINTKYWQALERGEMTKPFILTERFREFFETEGLDAGKAASFNEQFQSALGDTIVFFDNAYELLERLKGNYVLAAVTNGTADAQHKKLSRSGLDRIFDFVFISDLMGVEKPDPAFFDIAFEKMGLEDRSKAIIIGDSLTSDIKGGNNAGIDTCWYNPGGKKNDSTSVVTYTIDDLNKITEIIS